MTAAFSFLHDNRTYTCYPERRAGEQSEMWWWFTVSHDQNRYAPFLARPSDTRASTQSRILAYYANHLAHRRMTDQQRHQGRRDKAAAATQAKPAAPRTNVNPSARKGRGRQG
jgi:hypothetical protein